MFIGTGIRHYLAVLRQWLWLIVAVVIVCTGTTYVVNNKTTPVYEASALVQVNDTRTSNGSVFTEQALAQSYALLVNRPDVLQVVAKKVPSTTEYQLEAQVSASPLNNTPIIQVRAQATNPTLAARIVNETVDTFIKLQVEDSTNRLTGVLNKLSKDVTDAKKKLEDEQQKLFDLQQSQAPQNLIKRQNDILNSDQVNYNALQMSYTQVQQQLLQVSNALTVVQPATPPGFPVGPRTLFNTLTAAALSLLIMIVFALLMDWLDTTLKTREDIERMAFLPALGSLPVCVKEKNSANLPLINNDRMEQALTGIVTNLHLQHNGKGSLLVTGLHHGAGTSTVAVNIAAALAHSGVRVLLVDANPRKASLHHVFKRANSNGFTSLLAESAVFKEGQGTKISQWLSGYKTPVPNLWFLPAGALSPQWAAVLRSPLVPTFVYTLLHIDAPGTEHGTKGLIDMIIFDGAPLEENADTVALASFVDSSVLVVKAAREQAEAVYKAGVTLKRLRAPVLGVVMNQQKSKHRSYFYASRHQPANLELKEGQEMTTLLPAVSVPIVQPLPLLENSGETGASEQGVLVPARNGSSKSLGLGHLRQQAARAEQKSSSGEQKR